MSDSIQIPKFDEDGSFRFKNIDLRELSDDEVDSISRIFCFDVDAAAEKFKKLDDWSLVLHAHLYMDHILNRIIYDEVVEIELFNEMQLSFDTKIKICGSFGLIDKVDLSAYRKFNTLRNKLSHTLFSDFSVKNFDDIINCCSAKIKSDIEDLETQQADYRSTKFLSLCGVMVMHLESTRQRNMLNRLKKSKSLEKLRDFIL